jgi:uncharacterized membrane protein
VSIAILYGATAIVFFGLDALGLRFIVKPVFDTHVGELFADPMRLGPAAVFYLGYVAGVLWFVSYPALRSGTALDAALNGAVLGLMCYATYEFSNYATLEAWSLEQVVIDCTWGTVLTGVSAWAGVVVTRALSS